MGPARRGRKKLEELSDSDSQTGALVHSEFDGDKDDDLADYLQANTSFLMAMESTSAFTDANLRPDCDIFAFPLSLGLEVSSFYTKKSFFNGQDLSRLSRKYLPPGNIYEMYQFYCGWCSAHGIEQQAS